VGGHWLLGTRRWVKSETGAFGCYAATSIPPAYALVEVLEGGQQWS